MRAFQTVNLLLLGALVLAAQDVKEFEKQVTEFTLPNGMHFILVERHQAPLISFQTCVGAGSVNDPSGQTGLARLVGRESLKGTETIGSRNWSTEKQALDDAEVAYIRLDEERAKGARADQVALVTLETQWKVAEEKALSLGDPAEYRRILAENGGEMSLSAQPDSTRFSLTLPANRLEFWFLLESQRLTHPVFRDFYGERAATIEERRANIESMMPAKQLDALLSLAFTAHPYRQPQIGWMGDLNHLRRSRARTLFETYYVPGNIVMTLVGDLDPSEARRLADKYFGPIPSRPVPPPVSNEEPAQVGQRTAAVGAANQPMLVIGYRRPDQTSRDDATLDALQLILAGGRNGLLTKDLVSDKRIVRSASAQATFPAGRAGNLFVFVLAPAPGHTLDETRKAFDDFLTRFTAKLVDPSALQRAKLQLSAVAARRLSSNSDIATLLSDYYFNFGNWRQLFADISDVQKVRAQDIQLAAARYFVPAGRTIIFTPAPGKPDAIQALGGEE